MAFDEQGPATSKYLSCIPVDRLNKAPVITINAFSNPDLNSVSVRLADLYADQGAGNTLKAGVCIDDEAGPDESKYAAYYPPETLHEAPVISIYSSADGLPYSKWGVSIAQTPVPTRLDVAKVILGDVPPRPELYPKYVLKPNMAPDISVTYGSSDENSNIIVDMNTQFLPMAAAAEILAKYRS